MKIVIDIDENVYTRLFDNGIQDNEIVVDDVCEMARALRLGTPIPDNATNGEVLQKLFNVTIDTHHTYMRNDNFIDVVIPIKEYHVFHALFSKEWFNAKYEGYTE